MALTQDNRVLSVSLAGKELMLVGFTGHEEMSRLFEFQLEFISDDNAIDPKDVVGQPVKFSVKKTDNSPRHFHGFVSSFSCGDEDGNGRRNYRARVVPWLWFLTRTSDCRIFQSKTLPDIISQIFDDLGFVDFEMQVTGDHPEHDYRVQYRETDFNFVSRLMEEEGMFYFFRHEDGKHVLVVADNKNVYQDCDENEVDYPTDTSSLAIDDHITSWEHRVDFRSGKWSQTDYNFESPSEALMTTEPTILQLSGTDKYEFYDYPGAYVKKDDGQKLTRLRMEEEEVDHDVVQATSLCKTFTPGSKFTIGKHKSSSEEGKACVITSIRHSASEPLGYETGSVAGVPYRNSFSCVPDSVVCRAARITPKPFVQGPQTAVVTGPSGEIIHTDEYGRVKVQFFWDREGEKDENTSCWIRVSHPWAGQNWGSMSIPHIGQEVIVSFLEGDPDRPVITGRVYNAEQMPPLDLPSQKDWTINRDHYGNEINMKADEGTISLICPSHTSEIHLGRSINLLTTSDHVQKNQGNTRIETALNWTQDIVGEVKVNVGSSVTEVYVGYFHKTIGGWTSKLIGGFKTEVIVGRETKAIKGAKIEAIRGSVYKAHDGDTFECDKDSLKKKSPSLFEIIDKCHLHYESSNEIIKSDKKSKIAGDKIVEAKKMQSKADKILSTADTMELVAKGNSMEKAAKKILKAQGKIEEKCAAAKKKASGSMDFAASVIKFK